MSASIDEPRAELRRRFPTWTPMSLHERLDRCADEFAQRPLVITDHRVASYADTAALDPSPARRTGLFLADLQIGDTPEPERCSDRPSSACGHSR